MLGVVVGVVLTVVGAVFVWGATVHSHHVVYRTLSYRSRVWFGLRHHRVDQVGGSILAIAGVLLVAGVVPLG